MAKKSIEDIDVRGKRVLLRVDFNVPLAGGEVKDDTRLRGALPTIRYLLNNRARVILVSHLGRPGGEVKADLRLDPVGQRLSELLNKPVYKMDQAVGPEVDLAVQKLREGELALLENIRFEKGEEKNDPELARQLAGLADIYVNDAFGAAHRAHASTSGVARLLPAYAGLLMGKEIEELSRCMLNPERPLAVILGGAKVSDKINVIRRFLDLADFLLIGGGMANTFLAARGKEMGDSLYEAHLLEEALHLLEESKKRRCQVELPVDLTTVREIKQDSPILVVKEGPVKTGWKAVDIGPETAELYSRLVKGAGMVIWNGPLGVFEIHPFHRGTEAVARALAESKAYSLAGGGDVVAALEELGVAGKIDFISTGGGAALDFWEGKQLPGVAALQDKETLSI